MTHIASWKRILFLFCAMSSNIVAQNINQTYLNPIQSSCDIIFDTTNEGVTAGQLNLVNQCPYVIHLGTIPNFGIKPLSMPAGLPDWKLNPNQHFMMQIPRCFSGRFWGRTNCVKSDDINMRCETGDCNGKVDCAVSADVPATLAEINYECTGFFSYDISSVDGYNLPMQLKTTGVQQSETNLALGLVSDVNRICASPSCAIDVNNPIFDTNNPDSPIHSLEGKIDLRHVVNGQVVGIKSSCSATSTPSNPEGDKQACCRAEYDTPEKCIPNNPYEPIWKLFDETCPQAYSFAYDDPDALKTCYQNGFELIFCPNTNPTVVSSAFNVSLFEAVRNSTNATDTTDVTNGNTTRITSVHDNNAASTCSIDQLNFCSACFDTNYTYNSNVTSENSNNNAAVRFTDVYRFVFGVLLHSLIVLFM